MINLDTLIILPNMKFSMAKFSIIFTSLCILLLGSHISSAQVNTVEFGKNRVQFKKFKWQYYQTKNFNTYFKYRASDKLKYFTAFSFSNNSDNIKMGTIKMDRIDSRIQGRAEMTYTFNRSVNVLIGSEIQRIEYSQKYDTLSGFYKETMSAGFVEGEIKISRKLAFKPGVRGEYSQLIARGNVVPRLAFAYKTGKSSQLSFAGGMFCQTAASQYLLQGYRPNFQQSIHYMLNYRVMKNSRTFRLEGYYKEYKQLIREKGVAYTPNQYRFNFGAVDNSGGGYAKGIDLFWRDKQTVKGLDYWI